MYLNLYIMLSSTSKYKPTWYIEIVSLLESWSLMGVVLLCLYECFLAWSLRCLDSFKFSCLSWYFNIWSLIMTISHLTGINYSVLLTGYQQSCWVFAAQVPQCTKVSFAKQSPGNSWFCGKSMAGWWTSSKLYIYNF